jgi:nitrogen fixation/metabolism regulation signal transduction histidine kinase
MSHDEAQILDRATHTIVQQVEAMKEMVNAFSDYARAPDMDISPFSMDKLAHEVVDMYRAQESEIRIELEVDPSLPHVEADVGRIRQILHNLIRNAIEALESTSEGRIRLSVRGARQQTVDIVEIVVADNGPGFHIGSISQIFDPYVTTKHDGTGLGLTIVKKIIVDHGGTIDALVSPLGGARFEIRLPREGTPESLAALDRSIRAASAEESGAM